MRINRNRLYGILVLACLAGYAWLIFNLSVAPPGNGPETGVCLVKHFTGIPCPSCGATRSTLAILQGGFLEGLYLNPFGLIILSILLVVPFWLTGDLLARKETLWRFYGKAEDFLRQKSIAIPAVLLVLMNWFWNIYKGL